MCYGNGMARILVCGGRDYDDPGKMLQVLKDHLRPGDTLVHGDASGADRLAAWAAHLLDASGELCGEYPITIKPHPANWEKHGKAAGPIRNQEMLDSGVDLVIVFPGGKGTADMRKRALKAGVVVVEVYD